MKIVSKDSNEFGELRRCDYVHVDKTVWAVGLSFNGKTRQFKGGTAVSVK